MGGASHSLFVLASHLPDVGYRPIIAGPQDHEGVQAEAHRRGIPYYPLYLTSWAKSDLGWRDLFRIPNRLNTLRKLAAICRAESVALVHTNLASCLDGALAARLCGLPHIMHVREEFSPLYREWFGGMRRGARTIRRMSNRVIVVAKEVARSFEDYGVSDGIRTIPNAVELPDLDDVVDRGSVLQKHGIPDDLPVIGVLGVLAERKGQLDFIRALRVLADAGVAVRGLIVGDSYDDYGTRVADEIGTLGLSGTVTLLGHQSDVWPLLRAIDLLAVPSRSEGFGRIVVEGMLAERPIVGTATGGIPDIVRHGIDGLLVPPGAPDQLAQALMSVLELPDRGRLMAETARRRALADYSPEVHVQRIAEVYAELLRSQS